MLRILFTAAAICLATSAALASGSGAIRDLSMTTFRACPAGSSLVEHYFVAGDATPKSYYEDVAVACFQNATAASWVFEASCGEGDRCSPMASPAEGLDPTSNELYAAPKVITFRIGKYRIAEDCRIVGDPSDPGWSCKTQRSLRLRGPLLVIRDTGSTKILADNDTRARKVPFGLPGR